jgi:phosphate transport system permease protein
MNAQNTDQTPPVRPRRRREMRKSARVAERAARLAITFGGVGTILAVSLIFVFLFSVAMPLFGSADLDVAAIHAADTDGEGREVIHGGVDEYGRLLWMLESNGRLSLSSVADGRPVAELDLAGASGAPTAHAMEPGTERIVLGFADGTARIGEIGVTSSLETEDSLPEGAHSARGADGMCVFEGAFYEWLPTKGLVRVSRLNADLGDPIEVSAGVELRLVDRTQLAGGEERLVAYSADGNLGVYSLRARRNLLTGETTYKVRTSQLPDVADGESGEPSRLLLSGNGASAYLAWEDGHVRHYDVRDMDAPKLLETVELTAGRAKLTAMKFLLGSTTLLVGDEQGTLRAWFPVRSETGFELVEAHEIDCLEDPITTIASSGRSRMVVVGDAAGRVAAVQVTTNEVIAISDAQQPVQAAAISPKEDLLVAFGAEGSAVWELDVAFPEATASALFGRVWYEGYPEPGFTWQSTGGTDSFEPKLSLMPLIYGTLKATLYSMLFGAPIAILAAIYSAEFLAAKTRASLKSLIEIMAGLPSVVLGFLAALVFAPFVQDELAGVLLCFLCVPACLLIGAQLLRFMPRTMELRLEGTPRLLLAALSLPLGILLARVLSGPVEAAIFGGDLLAWLDGRVGGSEPGWAILFLPVFGALSVLVNRRSIEPRLREASVEWSRSRAAFVGLVVFIGLATATFVASWLMGSLVAWMGGDLRTAGGLSPMGTYVQRNSLVVGFVMGFAIIPVIYTLSEDALSSVPNHLRLASFATGATRWQTAARVVVPTAASGIFSALMVGLGRAVGETMIVLMATGNTPVMEMNLFNGLRTLSANIAVELPEAVKDSTHYRTLFLAALTLFAMTFVVNTLAETVRQHFRKRAHQL